MQTLRCLALLTVMFVTGCGGDERASARTEPAKVTPVPTAEAPVPSPTAEIHASPTATATATATADGDARHRRRRGGRARGG